VLQETPPLRDGGGRTLLYILLEQDRGFLVDLVGPSGALLGREWLSPTGGPGITLDRGETHVEDASGLGLGHATFYGGDYLLAEVFGVGSHPPMIAYGSTLMLTAVDFGYLGQLDAVPGWPGADVYPPQPMVSQTRAVLDAYEARGGRYREEVIPDCGHTPHVEKLQEFQRLVFDFLEEQ
jgi:pimeloyl-ACP methyl ester carboxylesterase